MKMSLVSLGSVLFLAACSGGGSGKADPQGARLNPSERPSNPASKSYIKELFSNSAKTRAILPDESLLYSELFYGDYVTKVSDESKQTSLDKLNDLGQRYLNRIKSSCIISPTVSRVASGDTATAKEGDVITVKLGLSSKGDACELLDSRNADVKIRYLKKSTSEDGSKTVDHTIREENEFESKEIRNAEVIRALGMKSSKNTRTSTSESEDSFERVLNSPDYKYIQSSRYLSRSSGTSESVLENGTLVRATSESYSKSERQTNEKGVVTEASESLSIYKISAPGGDIWIGYSRANNRPEEFYLNGELMTEQEKRELFGE